MPDARAIAGTAESAVEHIFPHPPWPVVSGHVVRRSFIGALIAAGGLLAGAYYGAEVVRDFSRLERDRAFWPESGSPAAGTYEEVPATVRVAESNTKFILYSINLEVAFELAGVSGTHTQRLRMLFGSLDGRVPARVRFDPERPEHWSLNWAAQAQGKRMQAVLAMAAGGLLVGGSVAFLGFALWIGADRVRRVALRGITLAADVTEVEAQRAQGRATGAFIYRFRMPASHGGKQREAVFGGKHPRPLLLANGRILVVCVLRSDPNVFVVPREDLFPFDFGQELQAQIQARVDALR